MRRAIRVLNAVGRGLVGLGAIALLVAGSGLLTEAALVIGVVAWISAFVLWVIAGTIWMAMEP
jgi:hypothetical protein